MDIPDEVLKMIAYKAEGDLRIAISLLEQVIEYARLQLYLDQKKSID